jgi:hypothetical protein
MVAKACSRVCGAINLLLPLRVGCVGYLPPRLAGRFAQGSPEGRALAFPRTAAFYGYPRIRTTGLPERNFFSVRQSAVGIPIRLL